MNKIGVLTIHFGVNYGSALQAYALNKILNEKKANVELINYVPKKYGIWNQFYNENKNKYNTVVIIVGYIIKFIPRIKKRIVFERFLNNNLTITEKINSQSTLQRYFKNYQGIIVGSDQVWNSDYNLEESKIYYLSSLPNEIKRYSYAASFGKEQLNETDKRYIVNELNKFRKISTREDTGVSLLREFKLNSTLVLDPTLLIDKKKWISLFNLKQIKGKKFLLIYVMDYQFEDLINQAIKVADYLDLDIYVIAFKKYKHPRVKKCFVNLDPKEFLEVILNCSFVVTNSFHGIAFSINFKKDFFAIAKDKYNSRIESLLRICSLEERMIKREKAIELQAIKPIDYNLIDNKLEIYRNQSSKYIDSIISEIG